MRRVWNKGFQILLYQSKQVLHPIHGASLNTDKRTYIIIIQLIQRKCNFPMTPVPSYPPLGCVSPSVVGLAFLPKIGKLHFHAPTYFHLTAVSGRDVGLEHDNVGEVHVAELGHKSAASSINLKTIYNGRVYGSNAICRGHICIDHTRINKHRSIGWYDWPKKSKQ